MPGYDPETDVDQYGIGSVEFPTTLYDRPKLMLASLTRGNVDAMTRSMLAPDTLTPHEAQTLTNNGTARGALVWNESFGKTLVWAKQTILCTGGVGQVYRETTNPDECVLRR